MATVQLTVDVHCDSSTDSPVYRVYVDHDLYTERTWIWSSYDTFIREHLIAELSPGQHQVRIEKVRGEGNFTVDRFTLDKVPLILNDLSFTIS